jgi:fructuronate reductase
VNALKRTSPAPPARIAHLGLGAFHRAHQAWYTDRAADAAEWGIAAFTGRSPALAELLAPQDGLYTLVERAADGDRFSVVSSLARVADGAGFAAAVASPDTALVTLTVTEAGYRLDPRGDPDLTDPALAADLAALRAALGEDPAERPPSAPGRAPTRRPTGSSGLVTTALGRLVLGLALRHDGGGRPVAVVPCDNIPDGGNRVAHAVGALAAEVSPALARWIDAEVSFVSCSVDRITPRPDDDLADLVRAATGRADAAPVVTEPFSDWVLHGDFPAGRPGWDARFVADLEPWEARKLWLLNGAHSLLVCAGAVRGHATVAEAIADPACRRAVEQLWDEAQRHLPADLDVPDYRRALLQRWGNARIRHRLEQIAEDSETKLRLRIVPIAHRERRAGRSAAGCATVLAAWIRLVTAPASGAAAGRAVTAAAVVRDAAGAGDPVRALVGLLDGELAADHTFVETVRERTEEQ